MNDQKNLRNNFLEPKQNIISKNKIWKKIWKKSKIPLIVLGIFILIILIFVGIYLSPVKKIYNDATAGKNNFLKAKDYLLEQEFELSGKSLDEAVADFQSSQKEFQKIKWLEKIPWLGTQVSVVDNLLMAGIETGQAIKKMVNLAEEIVAPFKKDDAFTISSLNSEDKKELLGKIYQAKPQLEEVKLQIDKATDYVNKIPSKGLLKKIKENTDPLKQQILEMQTAFEKLIPATQLIPPLVGYPEQKTYLFLLQNNTELRPTGGFIGTYGILKVKNGEITDFKTDNIYNLDSAIENSLYIEPPWPLTRYNKVYKWFMRDSNWSPDFPTSAQKAQWFYQKENGPERKIDGVIAITPTLIESLLTLTGEIKVNGVTFNTNNVVDTLQYQVEQGFLKQGLPESERKEIIGEFSKILLEKLMKLPKNKWPDLWNVVNQNLQQKQMLVYLNNNDLQNMVLEEGWAGEVKKTNSDFLIVVDANLASLKSDPGVKRTIDYKVEEKNNQLEVEVKIDYQNTGTLSWKTTRYRTYTRIYVPKGSELIDVTGAMVDCKLNDKGSVEKNEELDKQVFGTFICIEPQEEKQLIFKYKLPSNILDNIKSSKNYYLLVQKQSGTINHNLNVDLSFNTKWKWVAPFDKVKEKNNNRITFSTDLTVDREFNVNF
jgi:hypothetical protein